MSGLVTKFGDWDAVAMITANLKSEMEKAAKMSVRRFALYAEKLAKEHMQAQDLNWKPLNTTYKKRKKKKGFSEKILVRTSTYFQQITSWDEKLTGFAGVKREAKTLEGESTANIAKIHEYGSMSRNIAARPLWQPVLKEAAEWHGKNNEPAMIFAENIKNKY